MQLCQHIPDLKKDIERIIREYEKHYNSENSIDSDRH